MDGSRPTGVMPLRPLTFGELLDAAVSLLRTNAKVFLGSALVLAALEQAALYPVRRLAAVNPPYYLPYVERLGSYWLMVAFGLATEAAILALLGGLTATAAGPELLGEHLRGREVLRRAAPRLPAVFLLAVVVGALAGIAGLAALLPWLFVYGLIGLVVPVLIVDRVGPGRALGRGIALGARAGLRATWLRLGGYVSWLAIRLAMGFGSVAVLRLFLPASEGWLTLISVLTWLVVDTIAYATLACFDAVVYLETRMRTEGLDISVGRTIRLGRSVDLAVER